MSFISKILFESCLVFFNERCIRLILTVTVRCRCLGNRANRLVSTNSRLRHSEKVDSLNIKNRQTNQHYYHPRYSYAKPNLFPQLHPSSVKKMKMKNFARIPLVHALLCDKPKNFEDMYYFNCNYTW